jgi:O-antigen/teichoic acid export membrane protein
MFIGISLFNLLNLFYHFFMIRLLPPVDYGHLNTLMALLMVFSVPASTVQTTITKFVSSYEVQRKYDQVRRMLRHLLSLVTLFAVCIFLIIVLGSSFLTSFFQISSQKLILLLGILLLLNMVTQVPVGGLQGLQRFGWLTLNYITNGGTKFILGILFVLLGWGVLGAMGAIVISYFISTFLSLLVLKVYVSKLKGPPFQEQKGEESEPSYVSEVARYFFHVGVALLCYMVLTNIDLILVKHFFTPIEAGYYSIAQMVGKIILFLPIPVLTVMFPKLTSWQGQEERRLPILKKSLLIAALLCGVAVIIGLIFPSLIIRVLSGREYPKCIPLVRFFCISMSFFALILILIYYHLSSHRRSFLFSLFLLTLAQIVLIVLFHETLSQVLIIVGGVGFCLFLVNLYLAYHSGNRKGEAS